MVSSQQRVVSGRSQTIEGAKSVRSWMKLTVLSAMFVVVLGIGVASAQVTVPTTDPYQVTTTLDPNAAGAGAGAGAGASQGLPRTGTSSSIPTAVVAAGMVAVGSVLAIAARRRNAARRTLS